MFSIVYQITQKCPFACDICLRRYAPNEEPLTPLMRRKMVDILKENKIGRLNVTGGEPTILGDELHEFLMYVHDKKIHTCLTTTGFRLSKEKLEQMDNYLDQILIPFHSVNPTDWETMYSNKQFAAELFGTVLNILDWAKSTSIIVEVNTVVHQKNINEIIDIGQQLLRINPNVVWRVDEYYGIGIKDKERYRFELKAGEHEAICSEVFNIFDGLFRNIKFTNVNQRKNSPEFLITHTGELVTSFDYVHAPTGFHLLRPPLPSEFKMLRSWSEFKKVCRDWGWEDSEQGIPL